MFGKKPRHYYVAFTNKPRYKRWMSWIAGRGLKKILYLTQKFSETSVEKNNDKYQLCHYIPPSIR